MKTTIKNNTNIIDVIHTISRKMVFSVIILYDYSAKTRVVSGDNSVVLCKQKQK